MIGVCGVVCDYCYDVVDYYLFGGCCFVVGVFGVERGFVGVGFE